jgi:hypothetical protein
MLAASALADSAVEHYRGSSHNRAMYVPLGVSALTLVASVRDAMSAAPHEPITRIRQCISGCDRHHWHRISYLQHRQTTGGLLPGETCSTLHLWGLQRRCRLRDYSASRRTVCVAIIDSRRARSSQDWFQPAFLVLPAKLDCCIFAAPITTRPS